MDPKQHGHRVRTMQEQQFEQPVLNRTVQAQLGRRLRVMFDGEAPPQPDRFDELIAELDRKLRTGEGS